MTVYCFLQSLPPSIRIRSYKNDFLFGGHDNEGILAFVFVRLVVDWKLSGFYNIRHSDCGLLGCGNL